VSSPDQIAKITVTKETVEDYNIICDEWTDQGQEDAFTLEEFNSRHPYFANRGNDACNWSVTGYPPQYEITLKNFQDRILLYIRQLEDQNFGFREIIEFLTTPNAPE